jgi:hypothetical protein
MRFPCLACAVLALLAGCNDHTLAICDITQPDCQEDIYYADLRLRGDGYDPFAGIPPIRTISEDQFRAELEKEAADAAAQQQSPDPWWDAALSLLGLLPSTGNLQGNSIDNQVQNTAAYYSPETRDVTVVAHPDSSVDPSMREQMPIINMDTLAHELVHALQDRELNLNFQPRSTDEYFAFKALVEGDASLYDFLFLHEIALLPGLNFTYTDPLASFLHEREVGLSDDPSLTGNFSSLGPPFFAVQWLVYPLGGVWLSDRWDKGGNTAVRHAYGQAPQRSLDFLMGPGVAPPAGKELRCEPEPRAPAEFRRSDGRAYGRDSFGAIYFFAYLMGWKVPSSDSLASALLWRNDVVFVYYNQSTQKTAVAWRIELDSPLPDTVLTPLLTPSGPRVVQGGTTLLITASDDPTFLATWNPGAACSGP